MMPFPGATTLARKGGHWTALSNQIRVSIGDGLITMTVGRGVLEELAPLRGVSMLVEDAVRAAFDSGLLTLSEIVFDKRHKFAVMDFSFHCGMLRGHGGMVVLQQVGGRWRPTRRRCGAWVS